MNTGRREFLKASAYSTAAAVLAGCAAERIGSIAGAGDMTYYADKPFTGKIRVGVIGVGRRGLAAVRRLATCVTDVEVTALCDVVRTKTAMCNRFLTDRGLPKAAEYVGPEGYKALADDPNVDVVYNTASRRFHTQMNTYAMRAGKHVLTDVPGAMNIEECWESVETAEETRRHCMLLENYCYTELSLLAKSLAASGRLGELVHAHCGYVHDQRDLFRREPGRVRDSIEIPGNCYPTHGIGPVAIAMDINRGDRFDYLISMSSDLLSFSEYNRRTFAEGDWRRTVEMKHGDLNTTLIRTVRGRTIYLEHDVALARPHGYFDLLAGTRGSIRLQPELRISLEGPDGPPKNALMTWMAPADVAKTRRDYMHPLWKDGGDLGKYLDGGHWGGDFLMDNRWAYCLKHGLPLDMSVYDLATWSAIVELTGRSAENRSRAVDVPDFTRGAWQTAKAYPLVSVPRAFLPPADTSHWGELPQF